MFIPTYLGTTYPVFVCHVASSYFAAESSVIRLTSATDVEVQLRHETSGHTGGADYKATEQLNSEEN
jgi:hypothetical protein